MAGQVTACVTTFLRPAALARLAHSIERHWPGLPILVQHTGGNLSWGRNTLLARCETPFALILEDDFELTADTRLELLLDVLANDGEIGAVGGFVVEHGRRRSWCHDFDAFRGKATMRRSRRPWRAAHAAIYRPCDAVLNFMLVRRDLTAGCPWDEDLPLNEHCEWFWRLKQQQAWRVAYCPAAGVLHHRDRPADYGVHRNRRFTQRVRTKTGLGFRLDGVQLAERRHRRPCVVVLGVGHANTTITARQLRALGWELGDADEEYAESVSVREINRRLLATGQFDRQAAEHALSRLPEPWALKDPRFAETLSWWLPALCEYEPLLLWVTKRSDRVAESYVRHEGMTAEQAAIRVAEREQACAAHFSWWPWSRLQLDAAQIGEAADLFDLARSS